MQKRTSFLGIIIFMMVIVPGWAMQTEVRSMDSFTSIKSSSSIDVILEKGSKPQVRVESEKVELDKIITEVINNELKVYVKKSVGSWSYKGRMTVFVSYQKLEAVRSSGSGDVQCKSLIEASDFTLGNSGSGDVHLKGLRVKGKIHVRNSGSGDLDMGEIQSKSFLASLSGSGDMKISEGNSDNIDLSINGSGDISASGFEGKTVNASCSGSGDIRTRATETLNARISGSGDISYSGSPKTVNKQKSGSGDIHGS